MTAAYTESLFDVGALDEESGIIQPGQWRLSLMETANWGTFSGFTALPVDRRGLLITGHSGSGKSTLLDALATVLTPPRARRLNAAARSDANRGDDRSIVSYVRGAWRNETDDTGNVTSSFLRPNTATWSGILLRYENGLNSPADAERESSRRNEPVELIVLFNLKAGSNARDGLSTAYLIMRGRHGLKELEPYAINGIDTKGLRKEYGGALSSYNEHSSFAAQFCRLMGIRSAKTLELLHKTQAAKNFGSLDELFRKFMLEEPATFRQADDAAEQFLALSQAHEGVVKLRRQMETLEPLAHLDESYLTTQRRIARLEHLTDVVEPFRLSLLIGNLESTLQRRTRDLRTLEDNARRAEADFERANENWNNAQSALAKSGASAITQAELSANQYEQQLQQVRQLRSKLAADLGVLGAPLLPETLAEWERFLDDIAARIAQQKATSEQTKDAKYKGIARLEELRARVETLDTELKHLRTHRTNVPSALDDVRNRIAHELGISPRDIPFSAELMSVRPEEAAWEGALERLLESQGKTLLVAHRFIKSTARFIDRTHLGLRLDYVDVPPENEVPTRSLSPLSAVRKIAVKRDDRHPEYSEWLNKTLRERFDFACVDSSDDMDSHVYALTRAGQIKRKNVYVKDDRHAVDDRSRWILGEDNDEKIACLSQEREDTADKLVEAVNAAEQIASREKDAQKLVFIYQSLRDTSWDAYDETSAKERWESAQRYYEKLSQSSSELSRLAELERTAKAERDRADTTRADAKVKQQHAEEDIAQVRERIENHRKQAADLPDVAAEDRNDLLQLFESADSAFDKDTDHIDAAARKASKTLSTETSQTQGKLNDIRSAAEKILHDFRTRWPEAAADFDDSFEDREAYLDIFRRIRANGLPSYEKQFMKVLHDFSQDQITALASTIRGAFREVKDRLYPVNRSLELSEYSPHIHLQIEAKDNRSKQVNDFLAELQEITRGTWSEDDLASAEARYHRTEQIIRRFTSVEYADRVWKNACLDTRQHVSFIAKEIDESGAVQDVHSSDAGLSGGQKQKLVIFCLAAALRYQLADEDQRTPSYGTVVLDEAFDKADYRFASSAMDIFEVFGFHMVLATPLKHLTVLEGHVGETVLVDCQDSRYSTLSPVVFNDADDGARASRDDGALDEQ